MSLFRPRKPSKAGGLLSIWEILFNGKFPFISDGNGKWDFGPSGYRYTPNFPSSRGGGKSGWDWMYPSHKELDPTLSYSVGKWAYISALNTLVTAGMTDVISNSNVKSCQGLWECCQNVPPASGGKFNVPVFPYPAGAAILGGATFLQGTTAPSGTPLIGDLDLIDPTAGTPILFWIYRGDI